MKRRICVFCETWESGGIESFLFNVLSHIQTGSLEIDLVVAELSPSVYTERLKQAGVSIRQLSGHKYWFWENYRSFYKLLKERHYSVLHLNAYQALSLVYLWLGKLAGIPVRIAHSHNTDLRDSRTRFLKLIVHKLFRRLLTGVATEQWACSENARRFMFVPGKKPCRFIPNGIDVERFRYQPEIRKRIREEQGWEKCFVIGCIGRLCKQKNQEFLLEVCAVLLRSYPNTRLLLIGEGEDRALLERKAQDLAISYAVIFYGLTTNVEQLLWAMDAFALPSRFEGLGIVAIEAQASGLSPVCSEAVPDEAFLPGIARRCPLDSGVNAWAGMLRETPKHRAVAADFVDQAGYSIEDVTETVFQSYVGGNA